MPVDHIWDIDKHTPDFRYQRELATFIARALLLHHQHGQDRLAMSEVRNVLYMGRTSSEILPTLVSDLVGTGIDALATDRARRLRRIWTRPAKPRLGC